MRTVKVILYIICFISCLYCYSEITKVTTNKHVICYETPYVCTYQTIGDTLICEEDTFICVCILDTL